MKRPTDWLNCTKVYCISWQWSIYLYVISLCHFQIAFDFGYILNGVGNAFSTNRKLIDFSVIFYRATLCVIVVIAVARCLSVCPSVTLVYCIQTAEELDRTRRDKLASTGRLSVARSSWAFEAAAINSTTITSLLNRPPDRRPDGDGWMKQAGKSQPATIGILLFLRPPTSNVSVIAH